MKRLLRVCNLLRVFQKIPFLFLLPAIKQSGDWFVFFATAKEKRQKEEDLLP